jgi:DNA-binding transcriptional ArsR family regulator
MNADPVTFAKALADETRQEIMMHLCCVWLSVNELVEQLGGRVNQPTVSHHLKKLEEANLVLVRQAGRQRFYTLDQKQIVVCCGQLEWAFAPNKVSFGSSTIAEPEPSTDFAFAQGKRPRITHLRVERHPNLRKTFLAIVPKPIQCDICNNNLADVYPWSNNLIEVHHLLPLSSDIAYRRQETLLQDVVALCPNCHKAVHQYYSQWLAVRSMDDFLSDEEAKSVYQEVKILVRIPKPSTP